MHVAFNSRIAADDIALLAPVSSDSDDDIFGIDAIGGCSCEGRGVYSSGIYSKTKVVV